MIIKTENFETFIKNLLDCHNLEFNLEETDNGALIWIDFGMLDQALYDDDTGYSKVQQKISNNNPEPGFDFDTTIECGPTIYTIIHLRYNKDQEEIDFPSEQLDKFIINTKDTLNSM
tara:strand:+ start:133 stop:483 length:351 start_codon:yes stop_codon:yes gene_type:complete